jgi:chemotaxis protein MotB
MEPRTHVRPRFARRLSPVLFLAAAALALPVVGATTGCATSKDLRTAKAQREHYRQQAKQNEEVALSARAEAQVYRAQLKATSGSVKAKDQALSTMTDELVGLQGELDSTKARYEEAVAQASNPLPPALSAELEAFAAANGDLLDYDAQHGVVRFKSDVTFGAGSAELRPDAAKAVTRLAKILNSPQFAGMDLMVAGHTDSKPVSRSSTIQKGHKDNWYLSSHRAIAVGAEMRKAGVTGDRMAVVGYADQRPVASNGSAMGRAQNRRVDVVVLANDDRLARAFEGPEVPVEEGETDWFTPEDATASTPTGPVFDK